jgi:hypothetical protein
VDAFLRLVVELAARSVRYVVIGVSGANYYAGSGAALFATLDRDLMLPRDADNLLGAWQACRAAGLELWAGGEPLGEPLDLELARRATAHAAATSARDRHGLEVDLSLVMTGFSFEEVFGERRSFMVGGIEIPVARLSHIVRSKAAAGREKDRLFLATHAERLRELLERE